LFTVTIISVLEKGYLLSYDVHTMAKEKRYAIGVDIGGTNIPCSIIDEHGGMIRTVERKTMAEQGPDAVASRIAESIGQLVAYFNENIKGGRMLGVGIGAPGALAGWKNGPIVELIKKRIKIPVAMDNDANCAAIGEHWTGAAKGCTNVVLITLGTGVGGGIIINNSIYRGSHGTAGEIGHITIIADGNQCGCGNNGCLEAYASANAAASMAKQRLQKDDINSTLREKNVRDITAQDIFLHAEAGDVFSKDILNESGKYLGIGIATFANIFDPDAIIIGGGFSSAEKYLFPAAIDEAYKRSFKSVMDKIKITRAKLGNDAGVIGAARLMF
jgi:glucokinase